VATWALRLPTAACDLSWTEISGVWAYTPITRQYSGSGHTEKFHDLLVARRQKGQGRHWSQETSDALAALRTLLLNDGWARYWQERQVLPLLAS